MSEPLTDSTTPATAAARQSWSPWRVVVGFGTISLAADMVYEGAPLAVRPAAGLARRVGAGRGRDHRRG